MSLRSSTLRLSRSAATKAAKQTQPRLALTSLARSLSTIPTATAAARTLPTAQRSFSTSTITRDEFENPFGINSLAKLTEEEVMLQEAGE